MLIRAAMISDVSYLPSIDYSASQLFRIIPTLAWIAEADPMPIEKHVQFIEQGKIWVAVESNELVGFIIVQEHDHILHIYELSVALSYQGRGIGKALITTAYEYAKANQYTLVTLTTFQNIPWNAPFYQKLGFQFIEKEQQATWLIPILEREQLVFKDHNRCAMGLHVK